MTLTEFAEHVGAAVVYTPPGCSWECKRTEHGVITSVNDSFVFVRYGTDTHSKATAPCNLALVGGAP